VTRKSEEVSFSRSLLSRITHFSRFSLLCSQCSQLWRNFIPSEFYNNCVVNYIRSNTVIAEYLNHHRYCKEVYTNYRYYINARWLIQFFDKRVVAGKSLTCAVVRTLEVSFIIKHYSNLRLYFYLLRQTITPSTPATMSKQRSTLLKKKLKTATMSNEFSVEISYFRQSRMLLLRSRTLLRHVAQNGNIVEATSNKVASCFENVVSTLLLVWTWLKTRTIQHRDTLNP